MADVVGWARGPRRARRRRNGVICGAASLTILLAAGCGSTTTTTNTTVAAGGAVSIVITAPSSGSVINADSVTVRGTVSPANATVQVQGRAAAVGNGVFNGSAALHSGKTTIDVIGSAPGVTPGSTSITITRAGAGAVATPPPPAAPANSTATPDVAHAQPTNPPAASGQTACGGGLSVGPSTTCAFAANVEAAYRGNGPGTVDVYSPVTHQTYSMTCNSQPSGVVCTGGNNASVYFGN